VTRTGGPGTPSTGVVAGPPRMSAQVRRQQLVDIGLDLLESRPIQELALDEVAAAAGVSRTLVFHYFPSKGDYFAAVVASAGERLMEAVPRGPDADVDTRLRSMVTDFLRFVRRKRGAYVALVRGASGGDPKVLAALDDVRSAHALRWLEAAGWPARDELTTLAVRGWLGSLEEVALAASTSPVPRSDVVDLLVGGLLADLARAELIGAAGSGGGTPEAHGAAAGAGAVAIDDRGRGG
jgi:AcrR family transcriptional regulator